MDLCGGQKEDEDKEGSWRMQSLSVRRDLSTRVCFAYTFNSWEKQFSNTSRKLKHPCTFDPEIPCLGIILSKMSKLMMFKILFTAI